MFEHVVDLSLGNVAIPRFRRRRQNGQPLALDVLPRSLYRLSGEIRQGWEHSIVEMTVPRWSITFRTLYN